MNGKDLELSKELILIDVETTKAQEALHRVATRLFEQGYVKESYIQAVQDREKVHPTALPTAGVGVAIPHTDVVHVNTPTVAVATLKEPVTFSMMGMPEEKVEVGLIFMLAIKEPEMQLTMLQNLMNLFQDEALLLEIKESASAEEILTIMLNNLETEQTTNATQAI